MIGTTWTHKNSGGRYLVVASAYTQPKELQHLFDMQQVWLDYANHDGQSGFTIDWHLDRPPVFADMRFPATVQFSTKDSYDLTTMIRTDKYGNRHYEEFLFWVVYQGVSDNRIWVRPEYEFRDGRFTTR